MSVRHKAGRGTLFVSSYGAIHALDVPSGEDMVVDNAHLVAWPGRAVPPRIRGPAADCGGHQSPAAGISHAGVGVFLATDRTPPSATSAGAR